MGRGIKEVAAKIAGRWRGSCVEGAVRLRTAVGRLRARLGDESGQGTVEYAILVGVLVVVAILAITVFRPKIEELWTAIAEGINGL